METSGKQLKCVVVTPERAVLDESADFVALPLFDGEMGVLPGRAPLIGRLGIGELRLQRSGTTYRYFVDGGFAQIRDNVVTVLTSKALSASSIDEAAARQQLTSAQAVLPKTDAERVAKTRAELAARALIRLSGRAEGKD